MSSRGHPNTKGGGTGVAVDPTMDTIPDEGEEEEFTRKSDQEKVTVDVNEKNQTHL